MANDNLTPHDLAPANAGFVTNHMPWLPNTAKQTKRFLKNPLTIIGLVFIIFFAFVALGANWLAPPDPMRANEPYRMPRHGFAPVPVPPNWDAWRHFPPDWHEMPLGTIAGQYDLYYGTVWGARNAFRIGVTVVGIALVIGILVGSLAGYFGGWIDNVLMRVVDIGLSFPSIILAIVLVTLLGNQTITIFGQSIFVSRLSILLVSFILTQWLSYSRLIRGEILSLKDKEFVQAARSLGSGHWRIIRKHVLPNAVFPVLVAASLDIGSVVLSVSALSFLGLGPGLDFADWGNIISYSRNWILGGQGNPFFYWWVILIPSLAISMFVLSWNLLGDAFRDILDPKLRGNKS